MTSEKAKQLLMDYRPGVEEPAADVTRALDLTRRDPALHTWLEEQQQFHDSVRDALRGIEIPADLKMRILAPRKIIPLWRKRLPAWAAAAALMALILVSATWLRNDREAISFDGYRNRMVGFALREYRMDLLSEDRNEIRQFLSGQGAPADYVLPAGLDALSPMGGARLSWQGNPVSMVCFALSKNEILYLFVMDENAIRNGKSLPATPEFAATKGLKTATWKLDGKIYLVAGAMSGKELESLLQETRSELFPNSQFAKLNTNGRRTLAE